MGREGVGTDRGKGWELVLFALLASPHPRRFGIGFVTFENVQLFGPGRGRKGGRAGKTGDLLGPASPLTSFHPPFPVLVLHPSSIHTLLHSQFALGLPSPSEEVWETRAQPARPPASPGLVSAGAAARASPGAPSSAWPPGARALPAALSALYLLPRHVAPETRLDFGSGRIGTRIVQGDVENVVVRLGAGALLGTGQGGSCGVTGRGLRGVLVGLEPWGTDTGPRNGR